MTRLIVSLGCGLVGFWLALSLLALGKAYLEAASEYGFNFFFLIVRQLLFCPAWATVIHQSRVKDAPGVKLKNLAANSSDPVSAWAALRLLWDRQMYPGTARRYRREYE
jgi:hypothetical protein